MLARTATNGRVGHELLGEAARRWLEYGPRRRTAQRLVANSSHGRSLVPLARYTKHAAVVRGPACCRDVPEKAVRGTTYARQAARPEAGPGLARD
jgi:hypothetical protein